MCSASPKSGRFNPSSKKLLAQWYNLNVQQRTQMSNEGRGILGTAMAGISMDFSPLGLCLLQLDTILPMLRALLGNHTAGISGSLCQAKKLGSEAGCIKISPKTFPGIPGTTSQQGTASFSFKSHGAAPSGASRSWGLALEEAGGKT